MDTGVDTEDVAPDATDARLNFTSPQFDPGLALQTTDLEPPVRDAPVLDNISKCAALLPSASAQPEAKRNPEEAAEAAKAAQAKKAKAAALKQRALKAAQRAEASVTLGSLSSIMVRAAVGPMAVLAKWQAAGQRVLVVTRHAAGVRGRAIGVLKGFDKFMNLILADAEEVYTVIIKVPRQKQQQQGGLPEQPCSFTADADAAQIDEQHSRLVLQQQPCHPPQQQEGIQLHRQLTDPQQHQQQQVQQSQRQQHVEHDHRAVAAGRSRVRWCRKQEQRYRRLDQVLIVGDNVVLVSGQPPDGLHIQGATRN